MISEPSTFIESFHLIRERVWERAKFGNWKIGIPDSNHHGRLYNRQETDFLEVTIQTPAVQVGVKFLLWHLGMTTSRGLVEGMMAKTVEDHAHYVLSALLDAGKLGIKKNASFSRPTGLNRSRLLCRPYPALETITSEQRTLLADFYVEKLESQTL